MHKPDQPPAYGFAPPQPPSQTVVVGVTPVGPGTQMMVCPSCHHQISTRTETECVTKTHLMALLLAVFCCWPCICVPYCMDSCKNVNHYCPQCNSFLGTYKN